MFEPGTSWQYSGGSYTIIQIALEDIFAPIGLKNTTMIQPNEKDFLTNVALVYDKDGKVIKIGLPITPQVAPSGLWSTPIELAEIAIEMQNALRNKKNRVVSHNVAKVSVLKTSYLRLRLWLATMKDGNSFAFLANGEKPNRIPVIVNTQKKILSLMNWKGNFNN